MFKHILVPLDGSKLAESALPVAASLAKTLKAPVTLLHVIEQGAPEEVHRDRHLTDSAEAEAYLSGIAQSDFPPKTKVDWHVHTAAESVRCRYRWTSSGAPCSITCRSVT